MPWLKTNHSRHIAEISSSARLLVNSTMEITSTSTQVIKKTNRWRLHKQKYRCQHSPHTRMQFSAGYPVRWEKAYKPLRNYFFFIGIKYISFIFHCTLQLLFLFFSFSLQESWFLDKRNASVSLHKLFQLQKRTCIFHVLRNLERTCIWKEWLELTFDESCT